MKIKRILSVTLIVLLFFFLQGFIAITGNKMSDRFETEDSKLAENTVRKYAVQCYALEGSYPESLDYLLKNYTLYLNKDKYVYHYTFIGDNMMPEISVFTIE